MKCDILHKENGNFLKKHDYSEKARVISASYTDEFCRNLTRINLSNFAINKITGRLLASGDEKCVVFCYPSK